MSALYRRPRDRSDRLWVRLTLSKADVERPTSLIRLPGDYLFTGLWYGDDPLNPDCYGKVVPVQNAFPVGRVSPRANHATLRRLGHPGRALKRHPDHVTPVKPRRVCASKSQEF
ncbi:hypothetical protein BAMBUS_01360 [Brevundimonas phage vB_BpoS-Bambus]|nr:hypothetical protein BAMBUS_01360 [Brevundimonas phage vB_BpoS-Bambus]